MCGAATLCKTLTRLCRLICRHLAMTARRALRWNEHSWQGVLRFMRPRLKFFIFNGDDINFAGYNDASSSLEILLMSDSPTHARSEEHTSEIQSLMRISYAVFCLKKN